MSRAITEEEFIAWQQHPVTKAVLEVLAAKREALRQNWEGGSFTDYTRDATVLVNVGNLGTCKGYAFVMDFTYEDYLTEINDDEHERAGATGSGGPDQDV